MFVMLSYDISSNKKRAQVAKYLKDFGQRVQKSVFEFNINQSQYDEIKRQLKKMINLKRDGVRFYRFCQGCVGKVQIDGWGQVTEDEDFNLI